MLRKDAMLDLPAYPESGFARLADRLAAILGTTSDVLLVQGEAIIALEAVATSLAGRGIKALNIVTSPYGRRFGNWLRQGGADVLDLEAEHGMPIRAGTVAETLARRPATNLVAVAHAESASGILNPLEDIAAIARRHGAVLAVDAVASIGGHPLEADRLGVDIVVIGPQKALGGSSGLSAVSISPRAWPMFDRPDARVGSILSIVDLKREWLDLGRRALPGMPSSLEFLALEAVLDRIEAEGLASVLARHATARAAAREGIRALGLTPWIEDRFASNLVTAIGLQADDVTRVAAYPGVAAAGIDAGPGDLSGRLLRMNHTGKRASREAVLAAVKALGRALLSIGRNVDGEAAVAAVSRHYANQGLRP
jgi:aspartate aminotransferase-like enzyme